MKKCPNCKSSFPDMIRYCSQCGSELSLNICNKCGNVFDTEFCPECGTKSGAKSKVCAECGTSYFTSFCPQCGSSDVKEEIEIIDKNNSNSFDYNVSKLLNSGSSFHVQPPPLIYEQQMVRNDGTQYQNSNIDSHDKKAVSSNTTAIYSGVPKSKWTGFFLCLFLGFFGAHKFYEGKKGLGLLFLFTGGLFGFGWFIDCIRYLFKSNPYYV